MVANPTNNKTTPAALDLVILGSGPAALTAALYAARAGLKVKVFERAKIGGALTEISHIANFPGFVGSGKELAEKIRAQAEEAGAETDYGECTRVWRRTHEFSLTVDEEELRAKAVIVATGSEPRPLDFTIQPPVSYCALCDGDLVKGRHIAVVGGGNSAVQESLYLANLAQHVTLITHSRVKSDHHLQTRLKAADNIEVKEMTEPTPELLNIFEYVFVFIGKRPATSCLAELDQSTLSLTPLLDASGYIVTGQVSASEPDSTSEPSPAENTQNPSNLAHQTVIPGLFAAGDVRANAIRQAITAAGDGAAAAIEAIEWLKMQQIPENTTPKQ